MEEMEDKSMKRICNVTKLRLEKEITSACMEPITEEIGNSMNLQEVFHNDF